MVSVLKILRMNSVKLASCPPGDVKIAIVLVWGSSSGYSQVMQIHKLLLTSSNSSSSSMIRSSLKKCNFPHVFSQRHSDSYIDEDQAIDLLLSQSQK